MPVAKVVEIIASSPKGFEDAVQLGLKQASKTIHGISGMDVVNWTVNVQNNKITDYRVTLHVAFSVDDK